MFSPNQLAANAIGLSDEYRLPWAIAPKALHSALVKAEQAVYDYHEAIVDRQAAEIALAKAENEWTAAAKSNIKDNKTLPPTTDKDRAQFVVLNAQDNIRETDMATRSTEAALGGILADEKTRNDWLDAMTKQLKADQAKLSEIAPEVSFLLIRIAQLESYSEWLTAYPMLGQPQHLSGTPFDGLMNKALNASISRPATPDTSGTLYNPPV